MDGFRVERTGPGPLFEKALALRYEVFCDEQGVPREIERDAEDALALHVVVLDRHERAAATGRVLRMKTDGRLVALPAEGGEDDRARIGRMAVRADLRRLGLGRVVLRALEEAARGSGLAESLLHAQLAAEPFYASEGYVRRGPVFEEAGIAHVEMLKVL